MFNKMLPTALLLSVLTVLGHGASIEKASDTKIVGGYPINIEEVPYQVSLRRGGKQYCGGSIIGNRFIVTAAHCAGGISPANLEVVAGVTHKDDDGQHIIVAKIYVHPDFSFPDYDIAVLELPEPLILNDAVQPITMARSEIPNGGMAIVSGWGYTEEGGHVSEYLLATDVPLITSESCKQYYGSHITPRIICAGYPDVGGKDACQGDSGGPLAYNNELVGVVSFGNGCGQPDNPGAYAKVSELRDFVYQVSGIE